MADVVSFVPAGCGCLQVFRYVTESNALIIEASSYDPNDPEYDPFTTENGLILESENSLVAMKLSELTTFSDASFPEGSFIPVIIPDPDNEGLYLNRKIDLSGATGFLRYIDVIGDGTNTITDARLVGKEIKGLSYETQFLNPANYDKEIASNTLTSDLLEGLSGSTIRLYY